MIMGRPIKRCIVLRLDEDLCDLVDEVSAELMMTRTSYIRRCLRKETHRVTRDDLPLLRRSEIKRALER